MRFGVFVLWLAAMVCGAPGVAQAAPFIPPEPKDFEAVEIYLHTVEVDNLVFNNFGHTAIRVKDPSHHLDMVYNWGLFDFSDPVTFSFRFFKGVLNYLLGIYPNHVAYQRYKEEGRTVWEDKLNLTTAQKQRLVNRLIWNAQPENRVYAYQYFFDNCSTRPRDYIDEALDGALKRYTATRMTGETFRDMVWSHYATNPDVAMSLDILMNSRIDREMSEWEKMFLPKSLRSSLLNLPAELRGEGEGPVISESRTLMTFPAPAPWRVHGYQIFWIIAAPLLGVALGGLWRLRGEERRWSPAACRFMGVLLILFGFYTGVIGVLMPVTWLFSDHFDLHHNANIWAFWPTDLVLVAWGSSLLRRGQPISTSWGFFRRYAEAHVIGFLLLLILWGTGVIRQYEGRVLLYMMPLSFLVWGLTLKGGLVTVREKS